MTPPYFLPVSSLNKMNENYRHKKARLNRAFTIHNKLYNYLPKRPFPTFEGLALFAFGFDFAHPADFTLPFALT